jgi:serine O-acetyltransferase
MTARPTDSREPARRFASVRRDLARYFKLDSQDGSPRLVEKLRLALGTPGLQAVLVYRLGSWARRAGRRHVLYYPSKALYVVLHQLCVILWGIHIDVRAEIAGGLYIGHFGGVLIGPARVGLDCSIAHNVTIGRRADGGPGVPTLGDRVWVGTGTVIFGNLTIGDGVTIGPLTVVARNLPPRIMVMGNPVRVLRREYDNSFEVYGARKTEGLQGEARPDPRAEEGERSSWSDEPARPGTVPH